MYLVVCVSEADAMRITVVDVQMSVVRDVIQVAAVTPETFAMLMEHAAQYRSDGYRWFVTPYEQAPAHTQPDDFGRVYDRSIRESFDRIRRTRACYRCGAGPEHCECPDEMEPDGAR
jgi:hypothetical protein